MNRILGGVVGAALMFSMAGCGGDTVAMPDVTAKRLDVALSDIDRAGIDEPEVLGGGMFGIVDESNWTVCVQEPAVGGAVEEQPRLTVERTCEEDDPAGSEATADGSASDSADDSRADAADDTPSEGAEGSAPPAPNHRKRHKRHNRHNRQHTAPATFVMPAVVGMNLQAAQDTLQARGSYILTQTDATGMERFQVLDVDWKVCWQKPAPGTKTPLERLVDLGAVKLDERCP